MGMERFCVFDLASVRFAMDESGFITVRAASGEVLASVAIDGDVDRRQSAFAACDAALASGTVLREDADGVPCVHRVALYNPLSGEVAVGPVPHTKVFRSGDVIVLSVNGTAVVLDGGELHSEQFVLSEVTPSAVVAARSAGMHPAPPPR